MISYRIHPLAFFVMLTAFVVTSMAAPKRKPKPKKAPPTINLDAERLAKAVPKFNPQDSKDATVEKMEHLIHLLSKTKRNNVSSNTSLVRTAMDFREDLGEHQRTISTGAIVKAWDTANAYGAINEYDHFTGTATKGRYRGEELVFENIVPAKVLPEARGYIGNLRLVPAPLARKEDDPLDAKDEAYAIGLRQLIYEKKSLATMVEIQRSKVGHLAMSKEEVERRWQQEVDATGEAHKQPPNIKLLAQKMGTPSKLNGNRYKLRVDVTNLSRYPTQVEIESTIVGYSDNGNKLYELRQDKRVLKLRRSQVETYLLQTPNVSVFKKPLIKFDSGRSQKVIYRGYTVVARFDGEIVASIGSDARLTQVANGQYASPSVITQASRSKPAPSPSHSSGEAEYKLVQFSSPKELASGKNGEVISSAPSDTIGLMANHERMYRLDSDGTIWIYEYPSFNASSEPLGEFFAGRYAHSIFSDGSNYFVHLSQPTSEYEDNDVVKFTSIGDFLSGRNGKALAKAAPGSSNFFADGKMFFKLHHGGVQEAVLSSPGILAIAQNTKPKYKSEGKLFCGKKHLGAFSDGTHYYLMVPAGLVK